MLTIKDNKVVIDANALIVPELKKIWEKDTSKDKKKATPILTYIHVFSQTDETAPFYQADYKDLDGLSRRLAYGDSDFRYSEKEEVEIYQAVQAYITVKINAEQRMIKIFDSKIDEMRRLINDTTLVLKEDIDSKGNAKFLTNLPIVTKVMMEIDKILEAKEKIEARIRKQSNNSKVKGDKKPSFLERKSKT